MYHCIFYDVLNYDFPQTVHLQQNLWIATEHIMGGGLSWYQRLYTKPHPSISRSHTIVQYCIAEDEFVFSLHRYRPLWRRKHLVATHCSRMCQNIHKTFSKLIQHNELNNNSRAATSNPWSAILYAFCSAVHYVPKHNWRFKYNCRSSL